MTIKDRGIMEFRTVALLPELITNLKKYPLEGIVQKLELDEQQIEYLKDTIRESMEHNREITITYFNNRKIEMTLGNIHHFDEMNKVIKVVDKFDECQHIHVDDILNIT